MAPSRRRARLSALMALAFAPAAGNAAVLTAMTEVTDYTTATVMKVEQYTASFTMAGGAAAAFSFKTRGYNIADSTISTTTNTLQVGPTFHASAGDTMKITLDNDMPANPTVEATTMNTLHSPMSTNLHTHGLHISSNDPQDDVYVTVAPGGTNAYEYSIASDHMGGTHWYHAHFHGNTALQVGNGLVGMIIIEDADDEIPDDLAALSELALMVQYFEPFEVQKMAKSFPTIEEWTAESGITDESSYWTVNGQITPTATVTQNQWTRVRVAYSSLADAATIDLVDTNSLGCEWKLIAKDGIYVDNAPRTLTTAHVSPGNRFDFVVKCTSAGDFTLTVTAAAATKGGGGKGRKLLQTAETLMTFTVNASAATAAGDLTVFTAKKPVYLQDVYDATLHGVTHVEHSLSIKGSEGACYVAFDDEGELYDSKSMGTMNTGEVQAWTLTGNGGHPFHIHINSFQLGDVVDSTGYYAIGDWHDVFYLPSGVTASKIYFQVDQHTGKAVLHCHFLEHEDKGCMAYIDIDGTADTRVTGLAASALVTGEVEDTTATGTTTTTDSAGFKIKSFLSTLAAVALPAALL